MTDSLAIPLSYLVGVMVMLWLVIGARGHWLIKAVTITIVAYLGISMWFSLSNLAGWATVATLPDKFEVRWIETREPNSKSGDIGAIYVWCLGVGTVKENTPLLLNMNDRDGTIEPRLYQLPYSRIMHEQSEQMQQMLKSGQRVFATMKGKIGNGEFGQEGKGENGKGESGHGIFGKQGDSKGGKGGGDFSQHQEPMFYQLPPPHFPAKVLEN